MNTGAGVRGTGRPRKIDPEALAAMVRSGATFRDVQDRFNVVRKSVIEACAREGIPEPLTSRGPGSIRAPEPCQNQPSSHPPRLAELIATGGRYADLRAWGQQWGVTEVKARQEWHQLRLPVRKGGVG
jgi:hypothetical protein